MNNTSDRYVIAAEQRLHIHYKIQHLLNKHLYTSIPMMASTANKYLRLYAYTRRAPAQLIFFVPSPSPKHQ